jgi:hypothetical protein
VLASHQRSLARCAWRLRLAARGKLRPLRQRARLRVFVPPSAALAASPILNQDTPGLPTGGLRWLATLGTPISPRQDVFVASRVAGVAYALVASVVGGAPSPTASGPDDNQSTSVERAIRHRAELESLRYAARSALAYRQQNRTPVPRAAQNYFQLFSQPFGGAADNSDQIGREVTNSR